MSTCLTCVYFEPNPYGGKLGVCRRYPINGKKQDPSWWCGEYRNNETGTVLDISTKLRTPEP